MFLLYFVAVGIVAPWPLLLVLLLGGCWYRSRRDLRRIISSTMPGQLFQERLTAADGASSSGIISRDPQYISPDLRIIRRQLLCDALRQFCIDRASSNARTGHN